MWAKQNIQTVLKLSTLSCLLLLLVPGKAHAITPLSTPPPSSGSYGLEATKKQAPPTKGATITIPGNGGSFSTSPTTVSGICPDDLLVQVYNNGVMAGSVTCKNGSFSIQITLYSGQNDITAVVFDDLDQAGPVSNTVTVTYNNTSFTTFGALITLTSNYGRRSANPGSTLTWPLQLTGGTGPYAFSIDWGDGKPELKSQPSAGDITISHVYSKSGIYHVTIKVTDVNGVTAYLQVTAIANGNVNASSTKEDEKKPAAATTKVIWFPAAVVLLLLPTTFWLGRRSELISLHKKLAKEAAAYTEDKDK